MVQGASTTGASSTGNVALFEGPSGTNGLKIFIDDTENAAGLQTIASDDLLLNPHGGSVGIGTTSPNYLLDVEGTGSTLLRLNSTSGAAVLQLSVPDTSSLSDIKFGDSANTSRGQIRYRHTGDSMAFSTAGTEAARIDSSGNFGIGTSSPSAKLHIELDRDWEKAIETPVCLYLI